MISKKSEIESRFIFSLMFLELRLMTFYSRNEKVSHTLYSVRGLILSERLILSTARLKSLVVQEKLEKNNCYMSFFEAVLVR